ncbi:hypothetical protein AST13_02390 [Staphylococcus xylosus]|uniref:DUF2977 domain-containing protein n=1 Tax=Staphylococcus xylosus TaxID=1288 RepID=UPI000852B1A3|nr:DUF2977 domain-containing protein [Staphylococcus xylosus]OEL06907.1 hypothetical protein AST13_02390 [Staphylococcus xylosus]
MQILVNENNEIVNYAIVGSVSMEGHNTIDITEDSVPELFFDLYKPKLFLYEDKTIVVNNNYNEEDESVENSDETIEHIIKKQQFEINHLYEHLKLTKPHI